MKKLIIISMLIMATGCTSTIKGRPDRVIPIETITDDVASMTSLTAINACNTEKSKDCRDKIIYAAMLGIDMKYHEFESKITNNQRDTSFLTTVATLGLNAAGAYTGASLYSAISAGLIGSEAAYESSMLENNMINTLLTQMTAQRNSVKARILQQTALSFDEYPLNLASLDIEAYYSAGGLLSAMKNLSTAASTNAANASKSLQAVNPGSSGNHE